MLTNQVTKKSSAEKFPSTSKYSDRSRSDDATHTVSLDTEFRAVSNPDEVVPPEDKVKAYKVKYDRHERLYVGHLHLHGDWLLKRTCSIQNNIVCLSLLGSPVLYWASH